MPAGCWARPMAWLAARVLGSVLGSVAAAVVLGAELLAAEVVQAFAEAWRVACTPVSIMLTALYETTESPANRPTAGVIASRLVIVALSSASSGTFAVALPACQRAKHSQPL